MIWIGLGLAVCHFIGWYYDLVVTVVVVWLLGLAYVACGADAEGFHVVLGAIQVLRMSLYPIVSTTASCVVDGTA